MSRIGKQPVVISPGVKVNVSGRSVSVEGPVGKLALELPEVLSVKIQDDRIIVERASDDKQVKALHGLYRVLIRNMLEGVLKGFRKGLEIVGVGYGVRLQEKRLLVNVGFSHPVEVEVPPDLRVEVPSNSKLYIVGVDKQRVGEFAAELRSIRPPEPYKGKGIRYEGEVVRRKAGKSIVAARAGGPG